MVSNYRFGPEANGWKGGRYKTSDGYIHVYCPEHPYANKHRYFPEHRLVMEKYLFAHLLPYVDVHHINGNKEDNRPENLQLLSHKQHAALENPPKDKTNWTCSQCGCKPNHAQCDHSVRCRYKTFWYYRKGHKYDSSQLLCTGCYNRNWRLKLQEENKLRGLFLDR